MSWIPISSAIGPRRIPDSRNDNVNNFTGKAARIPVHSPSYPDSQEREDLYTKFLEGDSTDSTEMRDDRSVTGTQESANPPGMQLRPSNRNSIGRFSSQRINSVVPSNHIIIGNTDSDATSSLGEENNSDSEETFFPNPETMENEEEIYKCNFVFKPVRQIKQIPAEHLIKVSNYLRKLLQYYMSNEMQNSAQMKNAIFAFLFIPNLTQGVKSTRKVDSIIKDVENILNSRDPVKEILLIRKNLIDRSGHHIWNSSKKKSEEEIRAIVYNLIQNGQFGKALNLLEVIQQQQLNLIDPQTGDLFPEIFQKIKDLHPDENLSWSAIFPENCAPYQLQEEDIIKQLSSTKKLSSTGLSGWSFEFIKSMKFADEDNDEQFFIKDLQFLFNKMLEGKAGHAKWWMGSKLVLIPKSDNSWRPIGIQNCLIRLMTGAVAKSIMEEAAEVLKPIQWESASRMVRLLRIIGLKRNAIPLIQTFQMVKFFLKRILHMLLVLSTGNL